MRPDPSAIERGEARRLSALALLVAGTFFMENLDAAVIVPAIPRMAESFRVAPIDLSRGVSVYLLTLGVFIPVSGWVAERYGARKVFASAIALFTIASLLCGLSSSLPAFTALRMLQAVGGALMVPVGRLVVLSATPKERLIEVIATLSWPALGALVLGPPLGGFIADHAGWRWIFYINLPLGLAAIALTMVLVPDQHGDERRRFDWPGFVLTGGASFCLLWGAEALTHPPMPWVATACSAAAGTALLWLAARHLNRSAHPIVRLAALDYPTFRVALCGGSLFRMGISAMPFLLPLLFQLGFGFSAFHAGAMLTIVFAGNIAAKPLTTPVLRRVGFRRVLVVTGVLNAVAIAGSCLLSPSLPPPAIVTILFLSGMVRSMQFTAFGTLAFADVPQQEMPAANTLFYAVFQLTVGLGVALGAVAWRIGAVVAGPVAAPTVPFHIAFLIIAAVSLIGITDSLKLAPAAGRHLARRAPSRAAAPLKETHR